MAKRDKRITRFDLKAFGDRFREERRHWDDGELGECMTLTPSAIAALEAGKVNPDGYLIFKMAACGLDIQYIMTGVRSGNTNDVAASIGRFDELELESDELTSAAIRRARAEVLRVQPAAQPFSDLDIAMAKLVKGSPEEGGVVAWIELALKTLPWREDEATATQLLFSILLHDNLAEALNGRL